MLDLAGAPTALVARGGARPGALRAIERHDLPELHGVPASFTDLAALPDGRVVYAACAEATDDPVRDGDFAGAVVGRPRRRVGDARSPRTRSRASGRSRPTATRVELLLVADADDRAIPAPLLRAQLSGEVRLIVAEHVAQLRRPVSPTSTTVPGQYGLPRPASPRKTRLVDPASRC